MERLTVFFNESTKKMEDLTLLKKYGTNTNRKKIRTLTSLLLRQFPSSFCAFLTNQTVGASDSQAIVHVRVKFQFRRDGRVRIIYQSRARDFLASRRGQRDKATM